MDTAQGSHQKRSIKVKQFLGDFRSGASDEELMEKYRLGEAGLDRFFNMLVERSILAPEEIEYDLYFESDSMLQRIRNPTETI